MRSSVKILWVPKSMEDLAARPERIYFGSNRLRSFNIHHHVASRPDIRSEVLGMTAHRRFVLNSDILVLQKNLPHKLQLLAARHMPNKLVVFDSCDPVSIEKIRRLNVLVDLVVCSSDELCRDILAKGLRVPAVTVADPHEADPAFTKEHVEAERPLVTWYGMPENYPKFIKPMLGALAAESIVFRWTSSEDPSFINEPGFQQGVVWDMPKEDAWRNARSWQHFIRQSDIGIVPVAESIKSAHKILNYMAYGIPVVCSPTPAHRQIVEHGVNGFFASETSEWLHYIRLLKNPESRREMGRRAKASVLERYSVAVLADQYAEVLMRHYRAGSSLAYAEMKF